MDDGAMLATGGSDARVIIWRDCSTEEDVAAIASYNRAVADAGLDRAAEEGRHSDVFCSALDLGGRPAALLAAVKGVLAESGSEDRLGDLVAALDDAKLLRLIHAVREWNATGYRQ